MSQTTSWAVFHVMLSPASPGSLEIDGEHQWNQQLKRLASWKCNKNICGDQEVEKDRRPVNLLNTGTWIYREPAFPVINTEAMQANWARSRPRRCVLNLERTWHGGALHLPHRQRVVPAKWYFTWYTGILNYTSTAIDPSWGWLISWATTL